MKGKALTTLNEKDSLTDILIYEKLLMDEYAKAAAESDKKGVRRQLAKHFAAAEETQFAVYTLMNERGYYIPALASPDEVKHTAASFKDFLK